LGLTGIGEDAGRLGRRGLMGVGLAMVAMTAAGCGDDASTPSRGGDVGPTRVTYGDDPAQFATLRRPKGASKGVVVVIHGGFWRARYTHELGEPLAQSLAEHGWTAWNIEYRRTGNGGGDPATFDDVAAAIDALKEQHVDLGTVVTLGHSAGGHLATWAASRGRFDQWSGGVLVTHVISQAGVLDLVAADRDQLGAGAVKAFLGHHPGPADAPLDPQQQIPLDQPVWCVHGRDDDVVPLRQSVDYVRAARAAGATAELVEVAGDHFVVIDPDSDAWARTLLILDGISS
jgi:acetyl esterase/lipase